MIRPIIRRITNLFLPSERPFIHHDLHLERINHPGMKHTFFGYYDRCPWSPDKRHLLYASTNLDNYVGKDSLLHIGVYDFHNMEYRAVYTTLAWNFQQGAQQQWVDDDHVIINDIMRGEPISVIVSITTGKNRTTDWISYRAD